MSREPLSPYRGLTPFEDSEHDVRFFFGREREQELIQANLMASRLTVLYGETGVGKSSVLRAGVAHRLRSAAAERLRAGGEPELAVVVFEAWRDDPLAALRAAIGDAVTRALGGSLPTPAAEGSLADALQLWGDVLGGDLCVILDQVEEYFLYHGSAGGPGTLLAELPEAVNNLDLRVSFLLAVREDALAKLDVLKGRIPNVLGNYLRLRHLDREAARTAIVGPLGELNRMVGEDEAVEIEDALVDAVLDQVAAGKVDLGQSGRGAVDGRDGAAGIETPFLQLVMQRLWDEEQAAGSRVLRLETLERLGGAEQVVRDHVDSALVALSPAEQDLVAALLDHLVTPSGTKIAHEIADLAAYAGTDEATLAPVLESLGAKRILRPVAGGASGGPGYEIFHDVLAQPVLAWKAAHETGRKLERQRAEAARRHRRLYAVIGVAVVALALMSGLAAYALIAEQGRRQSVSEVKFEQQQEQALRHRVDLSTQSKAELASNPEQALADAVASMQGEGPESVLAVSGLALVRDALRTGRQIALLPSAGKVRGIVFSRRRGRVLTYDGRVARVWGPDGRSVYALKKTPGLVFATFGPDGDPLTVSRDGLRLWRAEDGLPGRLVRAVDLTAATVLDRRGGRLRLVTGQGDGTTALWEVAGRSIRMLRLLEPVGCPIADIAAKRDGKVLLAHCSPYGWRVLVTSGTRHLYTNVSAAALTPGGGRVLLGRDDGGLVVQTVDGTRSVVLAGPGKPMTSARFSPDGSRVATVDGEGSVWLWDSRSGAPVWPAPVRGTSAAFASGGRSLLIGGRTVRLVSASNGAVQRVLGSSAGPVAKAILGPGDDEAATLGADGAARLWQAGPGVLEPIEAPPGALVVGRRILAVMAGRGGVSGRAPTLSMGPGKLPASAVSSPDGQRAAARYADGSVRVWRAAPGTARPDQRVPGTWARVLAVANDGRVAAVSRSGTLRVGDLPRLEGTARLAAFSGDGVTIATTTGRRVLIRDTLTGRVVGRPLEPGSELAGLGFDPGDRNRLLTASTDGEIRIWNVAGGTSREVGAGSSPVLGAAFSPDGHWIVTAGPRDVSVVRAADGQAATVLRGGAAHVASAAFGPRGRTVVVLGRDGTVRAYLCGFCADPEGARRAALDRLGRLRLG